MYKTCSISYSLWLTLWSSKEIWKLLSRKSSLSYTHVYSCSTHKISIFPIHWKKIDIFPNSVLSLIIFIKILIAATTYPYRSKVQILCDLAESFSVKYFSVQYFMRLRCSTPDVSEEAMFQSVLSLLEPGKSVNLSRTHVFMINWFLLIIKESFIKQHLLSRVT